MIMITACGADQPVTDSGNADLGMVVQPAEGIGLYASPAVDADLLRMVKTGESLEDAGEVSRFFTRLQNGDKPTYEPWIRVRTTQGETGWVYAEPTLFFALPTDQDRWRQAWRLRSLLGEDRFSELEDYRLQWNDIRQAGDWRRAYRQGQGLQALLTEALSQYPEPACDWLTAALPGFWIQYDAPSQRCRAYADYREWLAKAQATPGPEDERFVQLCIRSFPRDSVEYRYAAWTFPTPEGPTHSLLGRDIHRSLLCAADSLSRGDTLFGPEIERFKQVLINDMTAAGITYWEGQNKILAEIDTLLSKKLSLFNKDDLIALKTRRRQFASADSLGIQLDYRSGRYD